MEWLTNFNNAINSFVWGKGVYLLLLVGLVMTAITGVFQITHIGHWFGQTLGKMFKKDVSGHVKGKSISQFQALCTALAATIGVGNIAGVAVIPHMPTTRFLKDLIDSGAVGKVYHCYIKCINYSLIN